MVHLMRLSHLRTVNRIRELIAGSLLTAFKLTKAYITDKHSEE